MMQVQGTIQLHLVIILIDSGSTHYFLDASLADRFSLTIEAQPSLWVMVANGRRLQCLGICHGVPVSLAGHCFGVDFFIIPLKGFGAVLGVNWLRNLRPISWDFSRMCMEVIFQGCTVVLHGLASDSSLSVPHSSSTHNGHHSREPGTTSGRLFDHFSITHGSLPFTKFQSSNYPGARGQPGGGAPYRYPHTQKMKSRDSVRKCLGRDSFDQATHLSPPRLSW